MPQFVCPKCRHVLNVREQDIGRQGRCNKCGTRIALIGRPGKMPLMATAVETSTGPASAYVPAGGPGVRERAEAQENAPATDKQRAVLRQAGATAAQVEHLTKQDASRLIDSLGDAAPPTEKQIAYLQRLGAQAQQINALRNRKQAGALIEEMHLQPTQAQIALLRKLGAPGERIARLKSKGEASALIEELRENS